MSTTTEGAAAPSRAGRVSGSRPTSGSGGNHARRRRRTGKAAGPSKAKRAALVVVAGALLASVVMTASDVLRVRSDLRAARSELEAAKSKVPGLLPSSGTSAAGTAAARDSLEEALGSLHEARSTLEGSLPLAVLRQLPPTGDALRSTDDVVDVVDAVTRAAVSVLDAFDELDRKTGGRFLAAHDGTLDPAPLEGLLPGLDSALATLEGVAAQARRLRDAPHWPVEREAGQVAEVYERALTSVRRARAGVALLPSFLGFTRPMTYLLALRNNAELRADGGMVLSLATMRVEKGSIDVARITSVNHMFSATDFDIAAPDWYRLAYGRLGAFRLFQNANLSAHFPTAADVMAQLYAANTGTKVDGVVAVDPVLMRPILAGTGAVTAAGTTVDATTVVPFALNEMYRFEESSDDEPGDESDDASDDTSGEDREALIAELSGAILERLTQGGWDARQLAQGVAQAAGAGHLQLWFRESSLEDLAKTLGVAGDYAPAEGDYLRVAVQNLGANKLDYFLKRHITHEVRLAADAVHVETTVTLENTFPPGQPRYVLGGVPELAKYGYQPGDHQAVVGIYIPTDAKVTDWQTPGEPVRIFDEAGRKSLSSVIRVNAQQSATVSFRYEYRRFPGNRHTKTYDLVLQPQAVATPDVVRLVVSVPKGWAVDGRRRVERDITVDGVEEVRLPVTAPVEFR